MLQEMPVMSSGGGGINPTSNIEDMNAGWWNSKTLTCVVGKTYVVNSYYSGSATSTFALSIISGATSLLNFKTSKSDYTEQILSMVFVATSTSVEISNNAGSNVYGISCVQLD